MATLKKIKKGQTVTEQIDLINENIESINEDVEKIQSDGNITIDDIPVKSVNGKTGDVSLSAKDVGAFPNSSTIKELDINNIKDTGVYVGTYATNPYYLIVIKYNDMNIYQELIGSKLKQFRRFTGTWSDWIKEYSTENPVKAGDIKGIELVDTDKELNLALLEDTTFVKADIKYNPSTKSLYIGEDKFATEQFVRDAVNMVKSVIVTKLPDVGTENTIYFVPNSDAETSNAFNEYIYVNGEWEIVGGTSIDLTPFLTIENAEKTYAKISSLDDKVSKTTTINGKTLYNNINLTAEDVGALSKDTILVEDVVYRHTNAEISGKLTAGAFVENDLVIAIDVGTYLQGHMYKYNNGKLTDITDIITDYVDLNSDQNINGIKNFNGILRYGGVSVATEEDIPDTSDFVTKSGTQTITGGKSFSAGISTDLIQSSNSKNIISNISNNTYVGDTSSYLWLQSSYRPVVNENGSYYELAYSSELSGFVEKDSMYYFYKTKYDESLNLFNEDTHYHSGQAYGDGGNIVWWSGYTRFDDYIKVSPYTAYTLSINAETNIYITMCYYNGNLEFISDNNSNFGYFVTPENCEYIRFACQKLPSEIYYIMLNEGTVRLPYTKYNSNRHISNGQATLLKNEYEKTLNLFKFAGESVTIFSGNEQWKEYRLSDFELVEGETYTISSYDVPNGISLQLLDGYNNFTNSKTTFVYNSSNSKFRVGGNSISQNTTFELKVQIIKGIYTGGYHEYHGIIAHMRDVNGILMWQNGNTNSRFGAQTVYLSDNITNYRSFCVIYKQYYSSESHAGYNIEYFYEPTADLSYWYGMVQHDKGSQYLKSRGLTIGSDGTSISFHNGVENNSESDAQCIPIAILAFN
jgi:hypothetical protein